MSSESSRRLRGERGASLILAIAFLVVVGGVSAAALSSVSSGINDRVVLDQARDRQYAADAGIVTAIGMVRNNMTSGSALTPCIPNTNFTFNSGSSPSGIGIQVSCNYVPNVTQGSLFLQRNVVFSAQCATGQGPKCPSGNVVIRAQVNFASPSIATDQSISVTRTYVQAWSVNA
jgi:hypothetical protein